MKPNIQEFQAAVLNALAHPLHLKILEKLRAGPCCVCKIIPEVGEKQSNVSHHLAIMKKAGILKTEKTGREVWYEVSDPRVFEILDILKDYTRTRLLKDEKRFKRLLKTR
ncbi:hypothetical protein BXT86_03985 [candidate division WOR-3 bacterium 4484_100]|uniref:HTH arsR-type domain-containing protein n=1 Tax=candidate division WOR-3 bacterium 4484_100 TaxID=1936077 RepID=A0A1V4QEX7_UNCW3|nr:MAG: hypothetical protein BXT86_03985 [candidate division WOR-3 bacterium 4484_100]